MALFINLPTDSFEKSLYILYLQSIIVDIIKVAKGKTNLLKKRKGRKVQHQILIKYFINSQFLPISTSAQDIVYI